MITTPLDSAVLDSKEQYVFYHKMVDFVLKELIVSVQQEKLCTTAKSNLLNLNLGCVMLVMLPNHIFSSSDDQLEDSDSDEHSRSESITGTLTGNFV